MNKLLKFTLVVAALSLVLLLVPWNLDVRTCYDLS